MPVNVQLKVRALKKLSGSPEARVPEAALKAYFQPLGVNLNFIPGSALDPDPTDHEDTVDDFMNEQAPPVGSGGDAILVVSDLGYRGLSVNGMLLDVRRRGACAVFVQASGFVLGDAEGRFEIYAHEIGHLLNLTHDDADAPEPTAMDTWDRRSRVQDRHLRWKAAMNGGPADYAERLRGFYGDGTRNPVGLPMSPGCCTRLVTSPRTDVEPWLSEFSGNDPLDAAHAPSMPLSCSVEVHGEEWSVGFPLDLTVSLRLEPGAPACEVPHLLDRASGELQIQLEQPDGRRRVLRSRRLVCTSMNRWLRPRQTIMRHESLIVDREGLVFATAGTYRVRAVVPRLHVLSGWVEIVVGEGVGSFASKSMQEFLRRGLPRGAEAGWRELDAIVSSKRLSPQLTADFRSRAAALGRQHFEGVRQFRKMASPAVAQRDALRRIAHMRRVPGADSRTLHRLIDGAESLFAASDSQHPTLDYLAHVRREILVKKP